MVRVKICGVTSVSDALLAVGAGADAIGLNFYGRSPRCVTIETARAVCAALPANVWRVGVFVDESRAEVQRIADLTRLDTLQFHGNEAPEYCRGWSLRTIKAIRARDEDTLRSAAEYPVDFILVDAYVEGLPGGTGKSVPREWLREVDRARLILAGGLTPENVAAAVRQVRPMAVDVASGVEAEAGRKDPERVKRFIVNAQNA